MLVHLKSQRGQEICSVLSNTLDSSSRTVVLIMEGDLLGFSFSSGFSLFSWHSVADFWVTSELFSFANNVFAEMVCSFSGGWFKKRLETFMKLSICSVLISVLPMYMNFFSTWRSSWLTPCRNMRGWGFGFCFSVSRKKSLHKLKTTLWTCMLVIFSETRVTSAKSWSSYNACKADSLVGPPSWQMPS